MSDEGIRAAVDSYLRSDPRIPPRVGIEVQVHEGVVTLTGSVPDKWVKRAVGDMAFGLPGVVDVKNNLQITQPAGGRSQTGGLS